MAFESNNFKVAKKYILPKSEISVECNINVDGEVSKVFTISSNVSTDKNEVLVGNINYNGIVETCVVYLLENGEVGSTHISCPFVAKFEGDNIKTGQKAVIHLQIKDYKIENITNGNIVIIYTIEQSGFVISNQEVASITSGDDDISLKKDEIKVTHFIGDVCTSFCSEIPLTTREPIKKLLLCESQASVKDVETGTNYIAVNGDVICRLLYLTESDKFETAYVFDNFKQELELEGVDKDSFAEAFAFVKYSEVKAIVDNEEKGAKVQITVPVELCAIAYNKVDVEVISDLYSIKNELEVNTTSFSMTNNLPVEKIEGKIEGSIVIDDDKPRIDKLLFNAGNRAEITNVYQDDDVVKVEGIARTTVVYLNDENSSFNVFEIEIPFVVSDNFVLPENTEIYAEALLSDVDVVVKKGRELFYDAKVKVNLYLDKDEISAVISEANIKELLPEKDFAMEIIFAKQGQSLWEIAKGNGVKEKMIATQNPDIVFPLEEDRELILFYQNNKN